MRKFFPLLLLLILASACSTDKDTLTYPSLYSYSHSAINSQKVYEVKNGVAVETTQNPFASEVKIFHDSLETVMNNIFETGRILSFQFLDATIVKVKGLEGTTPYESQGTYALNGTKVTFDGQDLFTRFNDDFSALNFCTEFAIFKGKTKNGTVFSQISGNYCTTMDHKQAAQNIIDADGDATYEFVEIVFIDQVFKK